MNNPTKMNLIGRKPRLTDAQENEIRRRIFKLKHKPEDVRKDFGISKSMLLRVTGGPVTIGSALAIERVYS